tara:strand:+ start:4973 stop:5425 length:453 start_codon:yes stop_codon:yes gene_type:complete
VKRAERKTTLITERRHSEWWMNYVREDINARRMKELEAKGKGTAARQQMQADGTRVEPHQGSEEKQRRVNQGQGGMNKGGAIVPTQPTSITKAPTSSIQKAPTSAITKKPESKGGALATTGKVTPNRGTQRYSKAYKEASPKPPQPQDVL